MAVKVFSERQMRSQIMRQKIRDAAKSLVQEKGYEGVTIDQICAEVGVTKGTFYNYFGSKEQLILDDIAEDNLYYRKKLRSQVAKLQPGLAKLTTFLRLAMAYENSKDVEFARLSYRLRIANPKKTSPLYPDKREFYKIIEELIVEGQASGEIRQDLGSAQLATAVLYSARGVVYSWCLPDTEFDLKEICEDVFEVLLEGLRKK
jgi:TetR/AcrR family transcriptional regulator, fatty acid metabolism regulator protein